MVKYTSWAHGSRDDILEELTKANGGQRSQRKHAELQAAIEALRAGAAVVKVGPTRYVVHGQAAQAADEFIAVMDSPSPGTMDGPPTEGA